MGNFESTIINGPKTPEPEEPAIDAKQELRQPVRPTETVRRFSKEKSPAERKRLAAELWAKRKEYFDTQESHKKLLEDLTEQALQKELEATEVAQRLNEIQQVMQERKASRLKALVSFFEIKKLGKESQDLEESGRQIAAAQEALRSSIQNIAQEAQDTTLLAEARAKIDSFYANQEKAWAEYQEAERARDVRTLTAEHDAYLIHAISDLSVPDTNSVLRQGTTFEQKAAILALEPTLSTSTIKEGDGRDNMWDRQGVILNRGRVLSASAGDAGTVAGGLNRRSAGNSNSENIGEAIHSAIENRPKHGAAAYNELIVEQPEVAAFFIGFDPTPGEMNVMSVERVEAMAARAGVPAYGLFEGRLYEIIRVKVRVTDRFSPDNGQEVEQIQLGRVVTPREILNAEPMPAEKKAELAESALENSAFRISGPEFGQLRTRYEGRAEYLKIASIEQLQSGPRTSERYAGPYIKKETFFGYGRNGEATFDTVEISNGEEIQVLTTIRRPDGEEVKIIELNGVLYEIDRTAPHNQEVPDYKYSLSKFEEHPGVESGYVYIGTQFGGLKISEPITRDSFTKVIGNDVVAHTERQLATAIADGDTQAEKKLRDGLKEVGYYLYGIGEQADQFGDTEVRDRAWQAAERLVPLATIREVMARRLNKNEGYRITKEELL